MRKATKATSTERDKMSTSEIDAIVMTGDLTKLSPDQRLIHYKNVCEFMEIDYRTHPLEYLNVDDPNGGRRLILYALRSATDQIRRNKKIKITKLYKELSEDVVTYICEGEDKEGITEISTGSIGIKGKRGPDLANAFMAAETKAKRRMTLAFSGSGLLDETEIADINAPTSLPAGAGVTAAQNVTAPVASSAAGTEVKLTEVREDDGRLNRPPTAKEKHEKVRSEALKQLTEKTKNITEIEPQILKAGNEMIANAVAGLADIVEKHKQIESIVEAKVDLEPATKHECPNGDHAVCTEAAVAAIRSKETQGILIETAPAKEEPAKVDEAIAAIPEDTKDALSNRIVAYKRDILPQGGMRPSKGFGINAKLIKYFLTKFPERKKMDEFTLEELRFVLCTLDEACDAGGAEAAVKLINETLGVQ